MKPPDDVFRTCGRLAELAASGLRPRGADSTHEREEEAEVRRAPALAVGELAPMVAAVGRGRPVMVLGDAASWINGADNYVDGGTEAAFNTGRIGASRTGERVA